MCPLYTVLSRFSAAVPTPPQHTAMSFFGGTRAALHPPTHYYELFWGISAALHRTMAIGGCSGHAQNTFGPVLGDHRLHWTRSNTLGPILHRTMAIISRSGHARTHLTPLYTRTRGILDDRRLLSTPLSTRMSSFWQSARPDVRAYYLNTPRRSVFGDQSCVWSADDWVYALAERLYALVDRLYALVDSPYYRPDQFMSIKHTR